MIKKIIIGLVGFVVLVVVALAVIPFFVDANKFKPQIEKAVVDNLNADFEIGNIKLSLWGGIHFQIDKMILSEKGSHGAQGIFAMKDASLDLPYSSIFGGHPDITLSVQNPEIRVVTGPDGKMNVMKIMKPAGTTQAPAAKTEGGKPGAAAALAFDLSFHIENGHIVYADEKKHTKTDLSGLDLDIRRFGINQKFDFALKTELKSQEVKDLTLRGPISVKGTAGIYVKPDGLDHVDLASDVDLSGLLVKFSDLFNKDAGVALKISTKLSTTEKDLKLTELKFIANDAVITMDGTVNDFLNPILDLKIESGNFVFENWQKILKPLSDFDMKGSAQLGVKIKGPVSKIAYGGKITLKNSSLKAPGIVPRVTDLKAVLDFNNDTVSLSQAGLKMGASDLEFDGTVKNFAKPIIVFNMNSSNLDVDSLLPQKTPEQIKKEEAAASSSTTPTMSDAQIEAAVAGPIYLMKKNPTMRGMDFTARANFKHLVVHKAEVTKLQAEVLFKDLAMVLKKATASAFGGNIQFTSTVDFKGTEPSYQANGEVKGIDINAAVTSQMPAAKDTIFGKTNANFNVNGSGVTKARTKLTLTGSAHLDVQNGSWSSLTAMKQIGEKVSSIPVQSIKDQISKINLTDKFRELRADIKIGGGRFNITNMVADMEGSNTTINGTGWVDFDMNNEISGHIMAPAGGSVPAKNRTADGRLNLPYKVGCKINSPCLDMSQALKELAEGALKDQGVKALKKAAEQINNPQVQDLLKKLPF